MARRAGLRLVGPIEIKLISGGHSNLTYLVVDNYGNLVVVRRPPSDGVLATAHDMSREWRFLSALRSTPVPVAEPLAFGEPGEIFESAFYVMSYVEGLVPHDVQRAETPSH